MCSQNWSALIFQLEIFKTLDKKVLPELLVYICQLHLFQKVSQRFASNRNNTSKRYYSFSFSHIILFLKVAGLRTLCTKCSKYMWSTSTYSNVADSRSAIAVKNCTNIFQRFCFKKASGKMKRYIQENLFCKNTSLL